MVKKIAVVAILTVVSAVMVLAQDNDVQIHGFVNQGFFASRTNNYIISTSKDGTAQFRELGINFQKSVSDRVHVGMQLLSRDIGDFGNNRVLVDWAYGTYKVSDMLNISAGRVKNTFGLYGAIQDYDFLRGSVLLPSMLYSPGMRTIVGSLDGCRIEGYLDLKAGGGLLYGVSAGRGNLERESSDIGAFLNGLGYIPGNENTAEFGIVPNIEWNPPLQGMKVNFSYMYTEAVLRDLTAPLKTGIMGMPTVIGENRQRLNWFTVGVQYMRSIVTVDLEAYWEHNYAKSKDISINHPVYGWIGNAQAPTMIPEVAYDTVNSGGIYLAVNVKPLSWLSAGGYFQYYDDQTHRSAGQVKLPDSLRYNNDMALTLGLYYQDMLSLKFEGHNVIGTANINPLINNRLMEKWQYGIVKVSYNF